MSTRGIVDAGSERIPKSVNGKKNGHANSVPINGAHAPQLRPFFGYYGGKWRDALKHYPEPNHETIVEPFAGSAGFSLRYAHRKIILCEIDPVLSEVWRYLIRVKAKEILAIPDLDPEGTIDDLKLPQEAKWLVGFWLNRGAASPRKSPSKWMREGIRPGSFWGPRVRQTIASQVDSIRHWQLFNCSYTDAPTPRTATWFVDPPYEAAGRHYRFGSEQLDYEALGAWCRSRTGQVIVCENEGATWLPFRELADVKTTRADRRSKEVIWLSTENGHRPSAYDSFDHSDGRLALVVEKQAEIDALQEEVSLLRAEVCKQVFGSRVVFDREVVARAKKEEEGG